MNNILVLREEQFVPNPDPVLVLVPKRTEFENMGWYSVLQIHEIQDSVPPVPVLVPKIGTIHGTGTSDVNSVRYSGLTFDQIRYSENRERDGLVPVPSHAHP